VLHFNDPVKHPPRAIMVNDCFYGCLLRARQSIHNRLSSVLFGQNRQVHHKVNLKVYCSTWRSTHRICILRLYSHGPDMQYKPLCGGQPLVAALLHGLLSCWEDSPSFDSAFCDISALCELCPDVDCLHLHSIQSFIFYCLHRTKEGLAALMHGSRQLRP
jgi:hypothetical protein